MSEEVAKILVESNIVRFNTEDPFTYASGIKSPIYTDCRILISKPVERMLISKKLQELILKSVYPDVICGTASAGIPWAAWCSQALDKPLIYVRKQAKDYGMKNQIEGILNQDDKVVILEDLVSTGKSSLFAADAVRKQKGVVTDVCCIFKYGLEISEDNFKKHDLRLHSLTTLEEVLEYCVKEKVLTKDQKMQIEGWKSDPKKWG